jgi:cell pole-organizing protein PopZ
MKRDRIDVLRSITALLAEVTRVSRLSNLDPQAGRSPKNGGQREQLISKKPTSLITDSLLRHVQMNGQSRGRKELERVVEQTFENEIQKWMDVNLRTLVDEVVEQEVAKVQKQRRVG